MYDNNQRPKMKSILLATIFLMITGSQAATKRALPLPRPLPLPPRTNLPTPETHTPPQFCHALINNPQPLTSNCQQSRISKRCRDGSYQLFSQMQQDYYIYTRHFRHLNRRGIYVDVGTNDPIEISNTFFMDACLGWSGLCVEAYPEMIRRILSTRSCGVVPTCVGDRDGANVEFVIDDGLSGVKDTNKNKEKWRRRGMPTSIQSVCTTLKREFARWDVDVVDYMSLDVEGHELHVLKGIDWNRVRINVMTVETTEKSLDGIEKYLESVGYVRHWPEMKGSEKSGLLREDAIFLQKDVVWGKPEKEIKKRL